MARTTTVIQRTNRFTGEKDVVEIENKADNVRVDKEYTPKLFSEDNSYKDEEDNIQNDKLFDQNLSDDEEFEIPAFLRKQKF